MKSFIYNAIVALSATFCLFSCTKPTNSIEEERITSVMLTSFNFEITDSQGNNLMDINDNQHYIGNQVLLEFDGELRQLMHYDYPDSVYKKKTKSMDYFDPILHNGVVDGKDVLVISSLMSSNISYPEEVSFRLIWPDKSEDSLKFFRNETSLNSKYVIYLNQEAYTFDNLVKTPLIKIEKNQERVKI